MLNNNYLRALPYELGKLFQLTTLGLKAISSKSRKKSFHNFRAILLGLMYCNCSPKSMAQENSWTSCWTTWQCLQATHSPGEQILISKCHNFMSIFQALDPAAAFGQGQPHRPLHSHVLQCSLRQVTASLSHVFPANLLLLLFLNSQKKAWSAIVSCPGMQRAVSMATARSGRSIGNTGSIKWRHGLGTLLLFLLCRKKGILDEVRHYAADIIAMQEVEIVPQIIVLT